MSEQTEKDLENKPEAPTPGLRLSTLADYRRYAFRCWVGGFPPAWAHPWIDTGKENGAPIPKNVLWATQMLCAASGAIAREAAAAKTAHYEPRIAALIALIPPGVKLPAGESRPELPPGAAPPKAKTKAASKRTPPVTSADIVALRDDPDDDDTEDDDTEPEAEAEAIDPKPAPAPKPEKKEKPAAPRKSTRKTGAIQ
jgi:hypothetical protein